MEASQELKRILHIDDEPDVLTLSQIALSVIGNYEVVTSTRPETAIELIEETQPDLIILDVMMPELDGRTLYKRIRQNPQTAKMPIIFMTARATIQEVRQLMSLGALGVVVKPFSATQLSEEIQIIWSLYLSDIIVS